LKLCTTTRRLRQQQKQKQKQRGNLYYCESSFKEATRMSTQPCPKTRDFFAEGTPTQMEWVLTLYDQCLKIKAESKSKKPDNIITLDKW
jgi:hypothetical protein